MNKRVKSRINYIARKYGITGRAAFYIAKRRLSGESYTEAIRNYSDYLIRRAKSYNVDPATAIEAVAAYFAGSYTSFKSALKIISETKEELSKLQARLHLMPETVIEIPEVAAKEIVEVPATTDFLGLMDLISNMEYGFLDLSILGVEFKGNVENFNKSEFRREVENAYRATTGLDPDESPPLVFMPFVEMIMHLKPPDALPVGVEAKTNLGEIISEGSLS